MSRRPQRRYEKTKNGFLMRLYCNIRSRVSGIQKNRSKYYLGKELMPKLEFYKWASGSWRFHFLFSEWESNGYPRKLTPTIDRIDSEKGYTKDNMRWMTHSENSRIAGRKGRKQL